MADLPASFTLATRAIMTSKDSSGGGAQLPDAVVDNQAGDAVDHWNPYPEPLSIRGRRQSVTERQRSQSAPHSRRSAFIENFDEPRPSALPAPLPSHETFSSSNSSLPVWIDNFINSKGNEYFCDIDEEYLTDRFNLTSLNTEVQYYQYALDLVTDMFDLEVDDDMREQIEKSARHLYGLVHARYIVTTRGLQKMYEKYKTADFGKCPRVFCTATPLLPIGQNDTPQLTPVKLYCPKCEDLYNPKSSRHSGIDGAYFGTSFPQIFLQVYPSLVPGKSKRRFEPKVFGFRVHAGAVLGRWQEERRREMVERLREDGGLPDRMAESAAGWGAQNSRQRGVETGGRVNDQPLLGADKFGKLDEFAGRESIETGFEDEEREDELYQLKEEEEEVGEEGDGEGIDDMFEGPAPGGALGVGMR